TDNAVHALLLVIVATILIDLFCGRRAKMRFEIGPAIPDRVWRCGRHLPVPLVLDAPQVGHGQRRAPFPRELAAVAAEQDPFGETLRRNSRVFSAHALASAAAAFAPSGVVETVWGGVECRDRHFTLSL